MIALWIDDIRPPPDADWCWVQTSAEALPLLNCGITRISFDHDLGGDDTTMPVAKRIEELCFKGELGWFPEWTVHSANPVGRANLTATMNSAERFFNAQPDPIE